MTRLGDPALSSARCRARLSFVRRRIIAPSRPPRGRSTGPYACCIPPVFCPFWAQPPNSRYNVRRARWVTTSMGQPPRVGYAWVRQAAGVTRAFDVAQPKAPWITSPRSIPDFVVTGIMLWISQRIRPTAPPSQAELFPRTLPVKACKRMAAIDEPGHRHGFLAGESRSASEPHVVCGVASAPRCSSSTTR